MSEIQQLEERLWNFLFQLSAGEESNLWLSLLTSGFTHGAERSKESLWGCPILTDGKFTYSSIETQILKNPMFVTDICFQKRLWFASFTNDAPFFRQLSKTFSDLAKKIENADRKKSERKREDIATLVRAIIIFLEKIHKEPASRCRECTIGKKTKASEEVLCVENCHLEESYKKIKELAEQNPRLGKLLESSLLTKLSDFKRAAKLWLSNIEPVYPDPNYEGPHPQEQVYLREDYESLYGKDDEGDPK